MWTWIGLVPISDNYSHEGRLCGLCCSGNAEKHNHKDAKERHNQNYKKMIGHFLMIMIMSVIMLMS